MRILLVHNYYQHRGGEDSVVEQEAKALSEQNEVKVISTKNKKGIIGIIQFLLYTFNIFEARRIVNQAKEFKADIIHIHNMHYGFGPLVIRFLHKSGFKIAMTLHNFRLICPSATLYYNKKLHTESIYEDFPWTAVKARSLDNSFMKSVITAFTYWLHKKWGTWAMVDKYFTFSDFSKSIFLKSSLNLREDQLIVKPNFVERNIHSSIRNQEYFVYIGRLSDEKGILQLLDAIAPTKHIIHIYGTGPLQTEVEQYAHKYPHIVYNGFQPSELLQDALSNAKALIVPSVCYEGMPMTVLEAFALGTPVIASDIGILAQLAVPSQTGLLFDPFNSDSIIHALNTWENLDSNQKDLMRKNCVAIYNSNYTKASNITLLENTYRNIITYKSKST